MFELVKDFRSITNKILVDYNKFKKWCYSVVMKRKKAEKDKLGDSRRAIIEEMISNRR